MAENTRELLEGGNFDEIKYGGLEEFTEKLRKCGAFERVNIKGFGEGYLNQTWTGMGDAIRKEYAQRETVDELRAAIEIDKMGAEESPLTSDSESEESSDDEAPAKEASEKSPAKEASVKTSAKISEDKTSNISNIFDDESEDSSEEERPIGEMF